MKDFDKTISDENSEKDFEAQKAEFLRLIEEHRLRDQDEDYGPWSRDNPSIQKLRSWI